MLGVVAFFLFGIHVHASDLEVRVTGVKPNVGSVTVSIFSSQKTFLKKSIKDMKKAANDKTELIFHLKGLKPGVYALTATYDENANGKLDRGSFGIPKEPVGFSNNAKGTFGPPKFEAAKFTVKDSDIQLEVTLPPVQKYDMNKVKKKMKEKKKGGGHDMSL